MRLNISRFLNAALLGSALLTTFTVAPTTALAQPPMYHDKEHNDDHHWDNHEDKAYRIWAKQNHRKYVEFGKLKENDQQSYWGWRHEHDDAKLKIVIK